MTLSIVPDDFNQREAQELGCERVDKTWEDENAKNRSTAFQETRRSLTDELREARASLPVHKRLQQTLARIDRLQAGPSVNLERSSRNSESNQAPPEAETLNVDRHLRVIEARVLEIEREIDVYMGLDSDRLTGRMISADKDKMILSSEFEGMPAADLSQAYPYLGSERTIRRVRAAAGLRGDGTPKPERKAA